jgi:heme exporter protein D
VSNAVLQFLAMGGYAAYVWPAYGLAVIVLGGLLAWSLGAYRHHQRELERLQGRDRP